MHLPRPQIEGCCVHVRHRCQEYHSGMQPVRALLTAVVLLGLVGLSWLRGAGLDTDAEAQALLSRFRALPVAGVVFRDDFNRETTRRATGPVSFGPGLNAAGDPADKAAAFPEDRTDALHLYYSGIIPRCGRVSLDFRVPALLPVDHHFLTLLSAGTAGNTKFWLRVGLDGRVAVAVMARRETLTLTGEPLAAGQWHHLDWWFGAVGAVLVIDGVVHDYSTDFCLPYAVGEGEAFYLGDQPWWDAGGQKGVFYPLDNFVGWLDNVEWVSLAPATGNR